MRGRLSQRPVVFYAINHGLGPGHFTEGEIHKLLREAKARCEELKEKGRSWKLWRCWRKHAWSNEGYNKCIAGEGKGTIEGIKHESR